MLWRKPCSKSVQEWWSSWVKRTMDRGILEGLKACRQEKSSTSKEVTIPPHSTFITRHLEYCVHFLAPKTLINCNEFGTSAGQLRLEHLPYEKLLRDQEWPRLEKRCLWENLTATSSTHGESSKRPVSAYAHKSGRIRANWNMQNQKRLRLDLWKKFFVERVTKQWNRLPRKSVLWAEPQNFWGPVQSELSYYLVTWCKGCWRTKQHWIACTWVCK